MNDWEKAIVRIYCGAPLGGKGEFRGTAFLIAPDLLLTANHVIEKIEPEPVFLLGQAWSGSRAIEDAFAHPNLDAAVVRLPTPEKTVPIAPLELSGQCQLRVGQELELIGFSSEDGDRAKLKCNCSHYEGNSGVWVVDRSVAKGMSGSPAVVDGRVVGILIWRHKDPHTQHSYVVTIDRLCEFLKFYMLDTARNENPKGILQGHSPSSQSPSSNTADTSRIRRLALEVKKTLSQDVFELNEQDRPIVLTTNDFEVLGATGAVRDHASNLIWEQAGSYPLIYANVQSHIDRLNHSKFAGYVDWRLPTVVELLSLLSKEPFRGSFVSSVFDRKQANCWSADTDPPGNAWGVSFNLGKVVRCAVTFACSVRAVRNF